MVQAELLSQHRDRTADIFPERKAKAAVKKLVTPLRRAQRSFTADVSGSKILAFEILIKQMDSKGEGVITDLLRSTDGIFDIAHIDSSIADEVRILIANGTHGTAFRSIQDTETRRVVPTAVPHVYFEEVNRTGAREARLFGTKQDIALLHHRVSI